ncbi:cbp/p300-interacting transactivator 4 [Callorhinus ursinus]|uniref:Cbp/p300-interacting transactivator 4 n=2 Tax=Otariidae TaxID=9702 RepID=A0A3Q7MYL6_CALUR|nr:cbp/p300-interacting transactivator 4 [Callorhinus ursinus]XP_027471320.1 cbp/p300-interacting transactivator 4 [Zalophus californianus]XP_027979186.1 cbp/p300-interacting transactivator 4 [Eumetopias jubatus]
MADHLMLTEGYRLVQRPPLAAPSHGPHALRTLQPYAGPGLDSGLRPRGTPLGPPPPPPPPPPPGALAYGAFGPPPAFQPFPAVPPPAAGGAHLQPVATLYPGRATAPPGVPGGPPCLQPAPGAPAPPPPAHALGCMDAELIDEEALTSLELELGLHRVRELPELFLGQSEFDCFSDLGSAPPAGSVSC